MYVNCLLTHLPSNKYVYVPYGIDSKEDTRKNYFLEFTFVLRIVKFFLKIELILEQILKVVSKSRNWNIDKERILKTIFFWI